MNILTILGMVLATSAVTLLCIRFGIVMTKNPIQADKVYHTTDDRSISHNHGKLLVVTIPPNTTSELNTTDSSITRNQQDMWISLPGPTFTASDKSLTNYSSSKHLQKENYSRPLSDLELVQDDNFFDGPSTSKNVAQPIDLRDESINTYSHYMNDKITTSGANSENNDDDVIDNTKKYQINGRKMSQRKINHNHQLNTNNAKYATVAKEDSSNGYQSVYDLTYNVGEYEHKEYDSPAYEASWTSAGQPDQSQGPLWSGSSGNWEPRPYGTGEGYLVDQGPIHKPLDRPSSSLIKNDLITLQPKQNNINWKIFVMLALFKLGIAKLQAIGFLNTLFQLIFSFKLYMTAVFFNFLLIMKLMKFFKILLLPLLLTRLLPLFVQLLMMPGRLLDFLRRLYDNNMLANQPGGSLPARPGGLLPNLPGGARPGGLQRSGMVRATGKDIPTSESTVINYNVASETNDSLFKLKDAHLTDVQSDEPTQLSDPTIDIFQKLLDSEKCVERIACRISMAEKTGYVPIWINWLLHRVHKFIPSDNLESYLKAYKDVNDEIYARSSVPDNWVTWCLERYNCSSSNNTTNVSNARQ